MKFIKNFKINKKNLSVKEKKVLKELVLASNLLASLYSEQKDNRYPGANFYPKDVSREEIKKAAEKNPDILSPYTFVERGKQGRLLAVPFHLKFKKELKKISGILRKAASLTQDKNFKKYLESRAKDLLTDNYDKSNILWLKTEKSKIGFVMGPFDRYLDKLFFRKRAYMAWVGVLDQARTKEAEKLKSMTLLAEKKYLPGAKGTKIPEVKVRIEDTAVFSGLVSDFMFVGNNLPSSADLHLIKKHGTLFTVFNPTIKTRFEKYVFPIFKTIFSKSFQQKYTKKELFKAFLDSIVLHETCHSLMRYEDATTRLEEFFPFFDELQTDILAIKSCGFLLLKDVLTQKEMEAFLIVYLCRHIHWASLIKKKKQLVHYSTGGAVSINFLFEGKALKKHRGIFQLNFEKFYFALDQLSRSLEYYMALGNRQEAKEFIKKHGSFNLYQKHFEPKMKKASKRV